METMKNFFMTEERRGKLQAALHLEASKAEHDAGNPVLVPAKALVSTLRDLLHTLVVDHGYGSNVEEMLKAPPFCHPMTEASRRIRPWYHTADGYKGTPQP